MTIMSGGMAAGRQAGRHGMEVLSESIHLDLQAQHKTTNSKWCGLSPPLVTHFLNSHTLSSLLNTSTNWGPHIQTDELLGTIVIQIYHKNLCFEQLY